MTGDSVALGKMRAAAYVSPVKPFAWTVLLIGGPSGVGKSTAAASPGRRWRIPWLQVDDLRLAFQRSQATLPANTAALYFFEQTPLVWQLAPDRLVHGLVAVGELMAPALEVIVENHLATGSPIIIEGDGILPSLFTRPAIRSGADAGHVRGVMVVESDEEQLRRAIVGRARGIAARSALELATEARAKWQFGNWITCEAHEHALPVVEARPRASLADRLVAAIGRSPR